MLVPRAAVPGRGPPAPPSPRSGLGGETAARSAVAGLPASKRATSAGARALRRGGESPRWGGLAGRPPGRRASVAALRRAALRSAPPPHAPPRRALGGLPPLGRRQGRHPGRAAAAPLGVSVGRRAAAAGRGCPGPGPARRFPVALPGRAGQAVGRSRASHARSPRGNGESGRRPRLSAARLPPGACSRKGPRREAAAAAVPGGRPPPARRRAPSGGPRAVRLPARAPAVAASGAAAEPRRCRRGEARCGVGQPAVAVRRRRRGGARGAGGAPRCCPAAAAAAAAAASRTRRAGGAVGRAAASVCGGRAEPGRLGRLRSEQGVRFRRSVGERGLPRPLPFGVFPRFPPPPPSPCVLVRSGEARPLRRAASLPSPRPRAGGGAGEQAGGGPSSEKGPLSASGPGPPARAGRCRKADNS